MQAYRMCSRRHTGSAFSGLGASIAGGRWNMRGELAVYLGESLALTALECLVHFSYQTLPDDYVYFEVTIPRGTRIQSIDPDSLPSDWTSDIEITRSLGSEWLSKGTSLLLKVPSAIIPTESNYVLNPNHPDFRKLVISQAVDFYFDPRLRP